MRDGSLLNICLGLDNLGLSYSLAIDGLSLTTIDFK